jgi:hypothetical protein
VGKRRIEGTYRHLKVLCHLQSLLRHGLGHIDDTSINKGEEGKDGNFFVGDLEVGLSLGDQIPEIGTPRGEDDSVSEEVTWGR